MAFEFAKVTKVATYKGHRIETTESLLQRVYVVDGNRKRAYWSLQEAKRAINGKPILFQPTDVENWFNDN